MGYPCKPIRAAGRATREAGRNLQSSRFFRAMRERSEAKRLAQEERQLLFDETSQHLDALHEQLWERWDEALPHGMKEVDRDA